MSDRREQAGAPPDELHRHVAGAAPLLTRYARLLQAESVEGPILDLACGAGRNGLYLAGLGLPVVLADRSSEALEEARETARQRGLGAGFWEVDLEAGGSILERDHYRAIMVFNYLHRPLIPHVRGAVRPGGILIYETFTIEQSKYGKPRNRDFLLLPGELSGWFEEWDVLHYFEGVLEEPRRAVAQIVCRKPLL